MKILLASGSPRRRQLLEEMGHRVTVVRPEFDESLMTEKDPKKLVAALAAGKGRSVPPPAEGLLVAADTVVVFGGRVLGKPRSPEEAFRMLKVRRVEHNAPNACSFGVFSLFQSCRATARLPFQKQKPIRNTYALGAEQFKTRRFSLKQGIKAKAYCRMVSIFNEALAERCRFKPHWVRFSSP